MIDVDLKSEMIHLLF